MLAAGVRQRRSRTAVACHPLWSLHQQVGAVNAKATTLVENSSLQEKMAPGVNHATRAAQLRQLQF